MNNLKSKGLLLGAVVVVGFMLLSPSDESEVTSPVYVEAASAAYPEGLYSGTVYRLPAPTIKAKATNISEIKNNYDVRTADEALADNGGED